MNMTLTDMFSIDMDFLLPIGISVLMGGIVGLEREINNKSAGFRTNILVAIGACIFTLISLRLTTNMGDPSRVIGQVVSGIGFLGAGVILHRGVNVHGLTTAATIWCSAALGCLSGIELYGEALVCALIIVLVNASYVITDKWLADKHKKKNTDNSSNEFE